MPKSKLSAPAPRSLQLTPVVSAPTYNPDDGYAAFTALSPTLAAIQESELVNVRVDVETAVYAAMGVAAYYKSPDVNARFARLPKEDFNHVEADGLTQACFAALFAIAEARAAGAMESDALVPVEIGAEAAAVEERMQTVCEYLLGKDPEISKVLDRLRPGSGYRDLANDLIGYARIYDLRPDVVKKDPLNYRPGDAARAKELAGQIIDALRDALSPQARDAYATFVRAWSLVHRRYEEIRQAGLWLYRKDSQKDQRFPSLFAVGRANGRPRKQAADAETDPSADTSANSDATSPAPNK